MRIVKSEYVGRNISGLPDYAVRVTVRGTMPELQEAGAYHAKLQAAGAGCDPEGRCQVGYPTQYGADTYDQTYIFSDPTPFPRKRVHDCPTCVCP